MKVNEAFPTQEVSLEGSRSSDQLSSPTTTASPGSLKWTLTPSYLPPKFSLTPFCLPSPFHPVLLHTHEMSYLFLARLHYHSAYYEDIFISKPAAMGLTMAITLAFEYVSPLEI